MSVKKVQIQPFYKKDNGVTVFNLDPVKVGVPFSIGYKALVFLPPRTTAGNHKHQRQEAFIGSKEMELIWMDKEGVMHVEKMQEGDTYNLFIVPPHVPHAVRNVSETTTATLFEFADSTDTKVERVEIV